MFALQTKTRALGAALLALALSVQPLAPAAAAPEVRLKDIVDIEGVRGNDIVGYGLVVGLNGTGDSVRNAPYTEEALGNLLERLGVNVKGENFRPKSVAAVLVTATLPPFARPGRRIDVTVSSIGDAKSLFGGTLVMTPLMAPDGEIYAVAQGPVIAGGVSAEGEAASVTFGVPTGATIPNGARVEREVEFALADLDTLTLSLRDPDFTTAARIEAALNAALGPGQAMMLDSGTVELAVPAALAGKPAHLLARIESISVRPDTRARVVVDQRSGTIVMGADVRISKVAVAQGNLTVEVRETPLVSQPNPFARGQTVLVPRTDIQINDGGDARMAVIEEGVSLNDLVKGLNALGVGPRDMIDILSAIDASGALHADLVMR
ncbi:MAG: flagellar basal body P-ring protein FlgI [Alphaproteobacteria bacterium]|nr:flagellar basal body P-ring protein FlgI [Alphaproteobacteria bacterium]MDX5369955.1 flagellar basal body P-ring protein FlgI [Alphaproteobacteria bacterium]MDX5464530.1 flagellar basal body P-ring protein FlgI [Alphaproteobacteria bacterium]